MKSAELQNELDRKHAERAERRHQVSTYRERISFDPQWKTSEEVILPARRCVRKKKAAL